MKKNMKGKIWRASAESKSPPEASATAQKFSKRHKFPHLAFCNLSALSSFQTSTSCFTSLHPHITLLRSLSAACWLFLMILIALFPQAPPSCPTRILHDCVGKCSGCLCSRTTISGDSSSFHGIYPSLAQGIPAFSSRNSHLVTAWWASLGMRYDTVRITGKRIPTSSPQETRDRTKKWPQAVPGEV